MIVQKQAETAEIARYKTNLSTNPRWAERALVALYDRQTSAEQLSKTTRDQNRMGFSQFDAEILSSFAQQVNRGRHLSPRQLAVAYRRLPKYAGQLLKIAGGVKVAIAA